MDPEDSEVYNRTVTTVFAYKKTIRTIFTFFTSDYFL